MEPVPFATIVADHGATVWAVCRSILSEADADDAWQETMITAMRRIDELDRDVNLAAWLTVVARNAAIDVHRRRSRAATPLADVATVADTITPRTGGGPDPVGDVVAAARLDPGLHEALDDLTARQRTAVLAHHVGGFSYAEIGELLGSSEDAARRSAADGIAKLRRHHRDRP